MVEMSCDNVHGFLGGKNTLDSLQNEKKKEKIFSLMLWHVCGWSG